MSAPGSVRQVPPLVWMRALRDTDAKPSPPQLAVLLMLASRMRKDGSGFAALETVAADAGVSVSTAKRAVGWAQDRGLLLRTRRGHRLGNGAAIASEYVLVQQVTGEPLTHGGQRAQQVTGEPLTPGAAQAQQVAPDRLSGDLNRSNGDLNSSPVTPQVGFTKWESSKRFRAADAGRLPATTTTTPTAVPPPGDRSPADYGRWLAETGVDYDDMYAAIHTVYGRDDVERFGAALHGWFAGRPDHDRKEVPTA